MADFDELAAVGHKPSYGIIPSTGYLDHTQGGTAEADVNVIG